MFFWCILLEASAGAIRVLVHSTHVTLLARLADVEDHAAWTEFAARYGDLIRNVAERKGLQPSDCDDVVQDVLLALTRRMPGFEYDPTRGKFRSYLKTVTLHAIFRRSRQKAGDVELEGMGSRAEAFGAETPSDEQWDLEWRQYHLRLAMRTIEIEFSEQDRQAFSLYAIDGRDARDTADELGLSVDQVYQAKSRILRRLSALVAEQVAEEG
ncbi:MAG: sigma-70 family RNA polymerase sigma factor [Phycisphaeraceae bacterium]|nr:MAG: sigma-70 family RNA polymerase sigma factor [Phycisphaeraceae bacterium]